MALLHQRMRCTPADAEQVWIDQQEERLAKLIGQPQQQLPYQQRYLAGQILVAQKATPLPRDQKLADLDKQRVGYYGRKKLFGLFYKKLTTFFSYFIFCYKI